MAQVETMRGPVDVDDLGPTLMHEHVFVLNTEHSRTTARAPGGTRSSGWPTRSRSCAPRRQGRRDDRRPDGHRPRPLHPPHPADRRRRCRPEHHRRHRLLHLRRAARTTTTTAARRAARRPRADGGRCSSATSPRASPTPGSRRRSSSARSSTRASRPGVERVLRAVRAGAPGDRRADHRAHQPGHARPGCSSSGDLRRGGRRPDQGRHRPRGDTNDLDYLERLADTGAILGMDRFGIDVYNRPPTRVRHIVGAVRARLRRPDGAQPRRVAATSTGSARRHAAARAFMPNWHYQHISDDVLPASCDGASPKRRSTR